MEKAVSTGHLCSVMGASFSKPHFWAQSTEIKYLPNEKKINNDRNNYTIKLSGVSERKGVLPSIVYICTGHTERSCMTCYTEFRDKLS